MSSIKEKVFKFLKQNEIPPGSRILIGLSGGPDSTTLLHILDQLKTSYPLSLACAYLDHGLRPIQEIEEEIALVKKICADLGVRLETERLARGYLKSSARSAGRSLEEVARQQRYSFLRDCAGRMGCEYIALGHSADDQIETLIMRFFQGVDITGLSGIPPRRGRIIRPLFDCRREEILEFLDTRDLAYSTDSTNLSPEYLRNSIRLKLVPAVQAIFPGFRRSLHSLSRKMRLLNAFLKQETAARLPWERLPSGFRIKGERFLSAPGLLRVFSLFDLINMLAKKVRRVPYRFVSQVADSELIARRRIVLAGYGVKLHWKGEYLFVERDIVCPCKKGYLIVVRKDRKYTVPMAGLCFKFYEADGSVNNDLFKIDTEASGGEIVVRSRRAGDRIRIGKGSKKVNKLLNEWEVPTGERWKIPVVADRQGIAAVLGAPLGYPNRFNPRIARRAGRALTVNIEHCCTEEM